MNGVSFRELIVNVSWAIIASLTWAITVIALIIALGLGIHDMAKWLFG